MRTPCAVLVMCVVVASMLSAAQPSPGRAVRVERPGDPTAREVMRCRVIHALERRSSRPDTGGKKEVVLCIEFGALPKATQVVSARVGMHFGGRRMTQDGIVLPVVLRPGQTDIRVWRILAEPGEGKDALGSLFCEMSSVVYRDP